MSHHKRKANRLIHEKSPYLLQHAYNPVDWYPWGEEAFRRAREEDKPIFLSIGYSTCHWCHVMERESFEDEEVAQLMNEVFINIKVDREERPDIDKTYMTVAQMITGQGGWPLTIIMTPDKVPFFAATYIPKHGQYGRPGMISLIKGIADLWHEKRDQITATAHEIQQVLQSRATGEKGDLSEETARKAYQDLALAFDKEHGGFSRAPKFPTPHNLLFLLRYWRRTGEKYALQMVEKTLQEMRNGGIFDQVGYGFHRYSTDEKWLVPHFEKMLYDQAMLMMAYVEAYQATGSQFYGVVVREIARYVIDNLQSEEGLFYSAEDADSEGVEGKYYLWTTKQLKNILSENEYELFVAYFNIAKEGNFMNEVTRKYSGENIPHITQTINELAEQFHMLSDDAVDIITHAREKLLKIRIERVHPHLDDKVLTDWNAIMIAAFAKAARALHDDQFAAIAERAITRLYDLMLGDDGILYHRYRDGDVDIKGFLDDYSFLAFAAIELYETTFNPEYLNIAVSLSHEMLNHFWDDAEGGFYYSGDFAEELLTRQKEYYDGAIPSGNSVAAMVLFRLARMLGDTELEAKAREIMRSAGGVIERVPAGFTMMLLTLDMMIGPFYEMIVVGPGHAKNTDAMLKAIGQLYLPRKIVLFKNTSSPGPIENIVTYLKDYVPVEESTSFYLCIGYECKRPITDLDEFMRMIADLQ